MVMRLRALAVHPEDSHPVPGVTAPKHQAHKCIRHIYIQGKHQTHIIEINKIKRNGLTLKTHLIGILSSFNYCLVLKMAFYKTACMAPLKNQISKVFFRCQNNLVECFPGSESRTK